MKTDQFKTKGGHAFEVVAPKVWKSLPFDLTSVDTAVWTPLKSSSRLTCLDLTLYFLLDFIVFNVYMYVNRSLPLWGTLTSLLLESTIYLHIIWQIKLKELMCWQRQLWQMIIIYALDFKKKLTAQWQTICSFWSCGHYHSWFGRPFVLRHTSVCSGSAEEEAQLCWP